MVDRFWGRRLIPLESTGFPRDSTRPVVLKKAGNEQPTVFSANQIYLQLENLARCRLLFRLSFNLQEVLSCRLFSEETSRR